MSSFYLSARNENAATRGLAARETRRELESLGGSGCGIPLTTHGTGGRRRRKDERKFLKVRQALCEHAPDTSFHRRDCS